MEATCLSWRSGGPCALLTGKALFPFDRGRKRFALRSIHGGSTAEDVRANTGFDYDSPADPPQTKVPYAVTLGILAVASSKNLRRPTRNSLKSCALN